MKEVDDCLAALGGGRSNGCSTMPGSIQRWCLIHATHMTDAGNRARSPRRGAVAGLCPITEASLGDGIFNGADYLAAGGRFGVGTDSNIQIDAAAELRQLEYGQRLAHRARNVMTGTSRRVRPARRLFETALAGGAQALQQPIGALAPGMRADIVLLDAEPIPTSPRAAATDGSMPGFSLPAEPR